MKECDIQSEVVVWLVRDSIRLSDNPSLLAAAREAQQQGISLIPLACLGPSRWAGRQFGLARAGKAWRRFRIEALLELKSELELQDSTLWISSEEVVDTINTIAKTISVSCVVTDLPLATEESLENAALVNASYRVIEVETDELFNKSQLPFPLDELPPTFSKFRRVIEKKSATNPLTPLGIPKLPLLPEHLRSDPPKWLEQLEIESLPTKTLSSRLRVYLRKRI